MKGIFEWILNNKEWLFSGLGITIAGLIYRKRERYLSAVKFYIKRIVTGLKIHKEKEKIDNSIFVSEEPLDGITIPCNHVFEKKWIVRNSGNTVWKNRYLKCIEYPLCIPSGIQACSAHSFHQSLPSSPLKSDTAHSTPQSFLR